MKKYMRCGSCGVSWPTFKAGSPKSRCANGHTTDRLVWVVQVTVDGKRKRTSFPTKQEADIAMAEMGVAKATTGQVIPPQRKPFGDYVAKWVESRSTSLSPNSTKAYQRAAKKVAADRVGKVTISALTKGDLRGFYARLYDSGLSVATISQVAAVCRGATEEAQASNHARINAGHKAWMPPKDAGGPSLPKAFTEAEMKALIAEAKTDELWPMWRLTLATAIRRGEVLGLKWSDVDADSRTIKVRRNMIEAPNDGSTPITGTPKSGHARTVPVNEVTWDILMAHKREQTKRRLQAYAWVDQNWVFDRGGGVAWNPSTVSMRFKALRLRTGIAAKIGMHGLRHRAASVLASEGVTMEIISKTLGHSNVAITSAIYSHLTEETLAGATDKITEALDG